MSYYPRQNTLDQALDIAGSLTKSDDRVLSDEPDGYGAEIAGQSGVDGYISAVSAEIATVTGLTGISSLSLGRMLTVVDSVNSQNTGTFLISEILSATSVNIINENAVVNTTTPISWTERNSYSLEDDINFIRTDRKNIKGTSNYYDTIPTYQRPSATDTDVATNLTNISGKTLDAHAWIVDRVFRNDSVAATDTFSTIINVGQLQWATATNKIGVPIWDGFDNGNWGATYVEIVDAATEKPLIAVGGAADGFRIFGRTRAGTTAINPNSVEIEFRAVALGADISDSISYTWDASQPTSVNYYYGFRERADNLAETAFRTQLIGGLFSQSAVSTTIDFNQIILETDGKIVYIDDGDILIKG